MTEQPPAKSERPYINEDGDTVIPPGWKEVPDANAAGSTEGVENEARRLASDRIRAALRYYLPSGENQDAALIALAELLTALSDAEDKLREYEEALPAAVIEACGGYPLTEAWRKQIAERTVAALTRSNDEEAK